MTTERRYDSEGRLILVNRRPREARGQASAAPMEARPKPSIFIVIYDKNDAPAQLADCAREKNALVLDCRNNTLDLRCREWRGWALQEMLTARLYRHVGKHWGNRWYMSGGFGIPDFAAGLAAMEQALTGAIQPFDAVICLSWWPEMQNCRHLLRMLLENEGYSVNVLKLGKYKAR